jgi:hypothetical protein
MKLSEITKNDITMLSDGFYLEKDAKQQEPSFTTFGIKRLMQDEEVGEAAIISTQGDEHDGIWRMTVNGKKHSARVGSSKILYKMDAFGGWVRKMLQAQLGEARIYGDKTKPVWLHRINKSGAESAMNDAKTYFDTEEEAREQHMRMVKWNSNQVIQHHLYSKSDFGTFKIKLVGGKQVKS